MLHIFQLVLFLVREATLWLIIWKHWQTPSSNQLPTPSTKRAVPIGWQAIRHPIRFILWSHLASNSTSHKSQLDSFFRLLHSRWVAIPPQPPLCAPNTRLFRAHSQGIFPYSSHFGKLKTFQHLQQHFFLPSMQHQIASFLHQYPLYSTSNPTMHKQGLYQPLPIPSWLWVYFYGLSGLPMTLVKNNCILVVVYQFSKWKTLFIPLQKLPLHAKPLIFLSLMSCPILVCPSTSSQIGMLVSLTHSGKRLALIRLSTPFSTTFHPQNEGLTEVINQNLVHALCIYYTWNKQWDSYLHVITHQISTLLSVAFKYHLCRCWFATFLSVTLIFY